jgi:hypothetical protein
MRERLGALRNRLGFAELATVAVLGLAFLVGGLIGGSPRRLLQVCGGIMEVECPPVDWVEVNPGAGLVAAVIAGTALLVLDQIMRRRHT